MRANDLPDYSNIQPWRKHPWHFCNRGRTFALRVRQREQSRKRSPSEMAGRVPRAVPGADPAWH